MRFTREQMVHKALSVLYELNERATHESSQPDFGARFALAYLWAVGESGQRQVYDRYWRALSDPYEWAGTATRAGIMRRNELQSALQWIIRDVGAPETSDYFISLAKVRRKEPEMCNLYRVRKPVAEVANLFGVPAAPGLNLPEEVYPGYPGLVVTAGALHQMTWGFPLPMKGKTGQPLKPKPVNNTRTDKLSSSFWKTSFERRRCLIPLTAFAEAEGPKGSKTRTWLSVTDQPIFAAAGIWRESAEWGLVFSMVMTEACIAMGDIHDRMPVLLAPENYEQWLDGSPAEAFDLCTSWAGKLAIERTDQPWVVRA